jgi:pyrroloquinoline-quinone synthase
MTTGSHGTGERMTREAETTAGRSFVDELLSTARREAFRDPTLDAILSGQMSRDGVRLWALQAMLVVRQFTRFISAIHSNCPHRDAQQLLAENLWEEHGRGDGERDHLSLIVRLAKSLGATDDEIASATPLAETEGYINLCFKVSREGSFVEAMAAIGIGIESFMPAFFGAMARGLEARYGLSKTDVEYLLVHVGEDELHARRAAELIERFADTDGERERGRRALGEMLAQKRRFAEALFAHCARAV